MKPHTPSMRVLSCRRLAGVLLGGLLACVAPFSPALAYESFTTALFAYQGIQVSSGMTEFDPTVLTVIIGDASDIQLIAVPDIDPLFEFSPDIDFHFGLTTNANAPVEVVAGAIAGLSVLPDTGFSSVTDSLLDTLDFTDRTATVDDDDLVVLLTTDTTYLFLEGITKHPDATISFTVWRPESTAVPEPGMLTLVSLGVLVVAHLMTHKHT